MNEPTTRSQDSDEDETPPTESEQSGGDAPSWLFPAGTDWQWVWTDP